MERIGKHEYYLGVAEAVSKRATCLRRTYGAVIVKDDEIVSTGYNGAPRGFLNCCDTGMCRREELAVPKGERYELCRAVHAEQNAIISASRKEMIGADIYIVGNNVADKSWASGQPCEICIKLIQNSGISKIIYRDEFGRITIKRISNSDMEG